jgi:pyruvate dehydrogenase E1 component
VIKVVWGRLWDPLLERDNQGLLRRRMEECVDGEYQAYKKNGGAYTREHFFGEYPELKKLVEHMSDDEVYRLNRGGHDPFKVYAAYHAAVNHTGRPTVILAKTVKGYATGAGEAVNKTHQMKKLDLESLKEFRDRFDMPFSDEQLKDVPYYRPDADSPEMRFMKEQRDQLGGYMPVRRQQASQALTLPGLDIFANFLEGSGDREISTTMAFVRMMSALIKDKQIGERVVPIVPDEARTFGMEGLFRQLGIYSSGGQKYEPEDAGQVMYYREDKKGRILEEGINEAGAMSGWLAAATSYSVHDFTLIPFYIYYSMFGFQRVGDLCWAAGDSQARGFLLGATAGRTTLNGEGLQHQDGHSHILASTVPNCVSYDPTYSYELAVILHDGLKRMYEDNEKVFYYLTLMNENYVHGAMPEGAEEGIRRGMYLLREGKGKTKKSPRVQLLGCGTILREVEAAAELLRDDFGVAADVWSVTSFNELRREGLRLDRDDILHPDQERETTWVEKCLDGREGPVIASTDYMRAFADQIRPWVHAPYTVLGTDGFGRSDSRQKLRHFFEVDRYFVVLAALNALRKEGKVDVATVKQAIEKYGIDTDKPYPVMH